MAITVPKGSDKEALEQLEKELTFREVEKHPAALMPFVTCFDPENQEEFKFGQPGWEWQQKHIDWWLNNPITITLKARQLGITWLAGLFAVWNLRFKPGSRTLIFSTKETEAAKAINRVFDMDRSLPDYLRPGKIIKPARDARPSTEIQIQHDNDRISSALAFTSSKSAGRGETAALVILDEFAFQEYANETWTSILPTAAKGGNIVIVSTANGVSVEDSHGTIGGNFYHHLWKRAKNEGEIRHRFLGVFDHPDRDKEWYDRMAANLPAAQKGQEYPRNEHEAFILTGRPYFDAESIDYYVENALRDPLYRAHFMEEHGKAQLVRRDSGLIRVFIEPNDKHDYAMYVDPATGRGKDYTSVTVVDLATMEFVAKLHGKIDGADTARQVHYLGRWFNTAEIAVESSGGYGEPIIIALRDGNVGRPAYPKLYRHRQLSRADHQEHKPYGFPVNNKTRPLMLDNLERAVRERTVPYMDQEAVDEYMTFVHKDTNPSPRAEDGANDDRVFSDAGALELFRQKGIHPDKRSRRRKERRGNPYAFV